jgi:hypothetical protein
MSLNIKKSNTLTKYCKICYDTGKPSSEYLSHFIRENKDPNSKIVCPTLLNLKCNYCFKNGHTVKYCPILKMGCGNCIKNGHTLKYCPALMNKKEGMKNGRLKMEEKNKEKWLSDNIYSCLDSDLIEEENNKNNCDLKKLEDDFPELTKPIVNKINLDKMSYVAVVSKPLVCKSVEINKMNTKASTMDWATWDSETESEEE